MEQKSTTSCNTQKIEIEHAMSWRNEGKTLKGLFYSILYSCTNLFLSLFLSLTTLSLLCTKYLSSTATPSPPPVAAAAAVAAWHTNIDRKKEREGRKKWIWICAGATRCERRCRFPQTTSSKNTVGKVKSMSCKKTTIFGHKNQEGRSRAVRSSNAMQQRATKSFECNFKISAKTCDGQPNITWSNAEDFLRRWNEKNPFLLLVRINFCKSNYCDKRRTYLSTYLSIYLPTYISTYLPIGYNLILFLYSQKGQKLCFIFRRLINRFRAQLVLCTFCACCHRAVQSKVNCKGFKGRGP